MEGRLEGIGVMHNLGRDQSRKNRRYCKAGGDNELAANEESLKIKVSISVSE